MCQKIMGKDINFENTSLFVVYIFLLSYRFSSPVQRFNNNFSKLVLFGGSDICLIGFSKTQELR